MTLLRYAPKSEFDRVRNDPAAFAALLRINVLYMVKRAGSGHLGTSLSCADIVSWLMLKELDFARDVFFSSKGHDVPTFYAAHAALGRLDFDLIHKLRRFGGLPGHPDVGTPGAEVNAGSLGAGISKAKGMIRARRLLKQPGRVFVLTGDGELQEGQIWESLMSARDLEELTVVVDHNKIQSDTWVRRVADLGDLEAKFRAFGWRVTRVDGHDMKALAGAFKGPGPHAVIADTVKGRGVSFMESFGPDDELYGYHSGAPGDDEYARALAELDRGFKLETVDHVAAPSSPAPRHKLVEAYARALVREAGRNPKLLVFNADLVKDCGLVAFRQKFPERFVECGIAEQDMVSQAGGAALKGALPFAHSFASFLSARPNEQIYTNATERTKVVYVATLAGLLPGTPGHSHQAVRDISSLGGMPNLILIQPCTEPETEQAVDFCANRTKESCYLRLSSIPCIIPFKLDAALEYGKGAVLREGRRGVVFCYGPVMTTQAYLAAEKLDLRVIDLPWLNRIDDAWLASVVKDQPQVITLDDHYVHGGQGDMIISRLATLGLLQNRRARKFGVESLPVCGQNDEVLKAHRLDAASLAEAFA